MKKHLLIAAIMLILCGSVMCAAEKENKRFESPVKQSLNGLWDFVVDLDPRYHQDNKSYLMPQWDRRDWKKVEVPGVWNHYDPRLDCYEGVCWFAREFQANPLPSGATALLRFEGVNYQCRVFLNEQEIGTHEGGYTEFVLDVTAAIKPGKNFLAVRVDNRAVIMRLPPVLGYFNYGGIHRGVTLEMYPETYLRDLFLHGIPNEKGGLLRLKGSLTGPTAGCTLRLHCQGAEIEQSLSDGNQLELSLPVPNVSPWSCDSPALYPVKIQLLRDGRLLQEEVRSVGFRQIEVRGRQIILNGNPLFLRGICYLYDSPVFGVTLKPDQYLEDFKLFREMGVNTIRSHFPFSQDFYDECDRQGILVWIEPPIYCIHPKTDETNTVFADPRWNQLAISMVREMVLPARSHPSVILYGIGNECNTENPEAVRFFQKLSQEIRNLDSTRLLSYASLYGQVGPVAQFVDLIGINEYWGWYEKFQFGSAVIPREETPKTSPDDWKEPIDLSVLRQKLDELQAQYDKPLAVTEFGADSKPGYISRSRDLWSENYHADLLRESFALFAHYPRICGTFPFCFSDYRDPSKLVNGYWDEINYKGAVSYQRRPKLAFKAIQQVYQKIENTESKPR